MTLLMMIIPAFIMSGFVLGGFIYCFQSSSVTCLARIVSLDL